MLNINSQPRTTELPSPSVVLHIPHSSTVIPDDVRVDIVLSDEAFAAELLAMTDHFTDELFTCSLGVARVVYPVSRLVVDPEQFVDDAQETIVSRGMGVIYTQTSTGGVLRLAPSVAARTEMLRRFYEPHHAALTRAVSDGLRDNGRCLIVDCHSFASVALPYELNQDPERPDICIGTDGFHTPARLTEFVCDAFRTVGYSVAVNRPFAGTIVPMAYYGVDARVSSVMIEVNRGLYMDEGTGARSNRLDAVAESVASTLERLGVPV